MGGGVAVMYDTLWEVFPASRIDFHKLNQLSAHKPCRRVAANTILSSIQGSSKPVSVRKAEFYVRFNSAGPRIRARLQPHRKRNRVALVSAYDFSQVANATKQMSGFRQCLTNPSRRKFVRSGLQPLNACFRNEIALAMGHSFMLLRWW
jgi:hypothetical protein